MPSFGLCDLYFSLRISLNKSFFVIVSRITVCERACCVLSECGVMLSATRILHECQASTLSSCINLLDVKCILVAQILTAADVAKRDS